MNDEIVSIVEERAPIETTITVDYIEVEAPKPAEIELDEAFPPIGEANEQLNHTLLHNRDSADQHPIVAITGLREELDEIESLKSVYADKVNVANYYKWNTGAYDTAGYFVSLVSHSTTIKICDGADIFGVTVDSAGFVGGQNEEIPRDNSYALVATSGLVDVRCESTVAEGDYVISNTQGMAEKTTSSCGYKVIAVNDDRTHDPGVLYATIALGVQACTTDAISKSVQHIEDRVDNNEINIAAAMNVANQAYNKAQESMAAGQIMGDQVFDALGKVEDMSSEFENIMTQIGNSAVISAQAKAIAESAATSAESMKNEAVDKANEALADASKLRKELEATVSEIDTDLDNATLELEAVKESLETTKNGLQESIDDVSKDLEDAKSDFQQTNDSFKKDLEDTQKDIEEGAKNLEDTKKELEGSLKEAVDDIDALEKDLIPLKTWPEGATGDDIKGIAGFVARADTDSVTLGNLVTWKDGEGDESLAGFVSKATSENAEIKALAAYTYVDKNGKEHKSVAALDAYADENKAAIDAIVGTNGGLAGLQAQVDKNTASVATLAAHVVGEYIAVEIWSAENKDTAKIYYAEDTRYYWYYDGGWRSTDKPYETKPPLSGALAGIQQTADANTASIEMIANLEGEFGVSLAGLVSKTTEENAQIKALAEYKYTDKNGKEHTSVAALDAYADDNKASIDAIVGKDGSLAGLQAQVDANRASVSTLASQTIGDYVTVDGWNEIDKNASTVYYAKDTKHYYYYKDNKWVSTTDISEAGLNGSIAGVKSTADANKAELDTIASYEKDGKKGLAGLMAQVDADKAELATVATYEKDGKIGLAGLIAQVDADKAIVQTVAELDGGIAGLDARVEDNTSSVTTLASQAIGNYITVDTWSTTDKNTGTIYYAKDTKDYYYYKNSKWNQTKNTHEAGLDGAIAGIQSVADENKAQLDAMVAYDKDGKSALAGLTAYVDENSAQISQLAKYEQTDSKGNVLSTGAAGLMAQVDANKASIDLLAEIEGEGLAGLVARVDSNESAIKLVSNRVAGDYVVVDTWSANDKDAGTIYYAKNTKLYYYYSNNAWTSTSDAYKAGLPAAIAGVQVVTDDNSSRIDSLTSWQGETNTSLTSIKQKSDANGASIALTAANIDKYSVGPYSQAYGFTLEQAKDVLEKGLVYVPTVSHGGESFNTNYAFTKANTYTWSGETWIEDVGKVVFSSTAPSGSAYSLWYTDSDTATSGYEPYTLYKYGTYATVDNNGNPATGVRWEPVATLKGNSQSRAVSQIRQDANSIEMSVTTIDDKYAGTKIWVDDNKSAIQDTVKWKSDNAESIATFMQEAGDNFASASQVAKVVDKDGNINAASIVTSVNNSSSSVVINADHIKFEGFVSFASKDDVKDVQDNAVYNTKVEYALSSSSSEFTAVSGADGQWSVTAPAWQENTYMWQKTTITKGDNSSASTQTCIQGANGTDGNTPYVKNGNWWIGTSDTGVKAEGADGNTPTVEISNDGYWVINGSKTAVKAIGIDAPTVVSEKKQFYLSTSNTSCVGGSWADSPSGFQYSSNKYMWSRSVYTMSDDSIIEGNPALDKTYTTISNWCMENDETIINGAHIATGTIDAEKINTNAIRSHNYPVDRDGNPIVPSSDDYFSSSGTFLDLSNGAFYSPNFAITNSGNAHFQGTVVAQEGEIAGWEITDQGLTKADTNIEIGLSPGNGGMYNEGQDNLGLVLYAGTKAPREPKAIAGTWRFTEVSNDIKDFLRDAYLDSSVEFDFYGWFNHPISGWTKYEGQNARLTFVYSGDEAFEITLSVDNSSAQMLWGCGSYNTVPWTSDMISERLLNREIGFGAEGIDDVWIGDYRFGTNILSSIATFIPGSIGLYPTMLDKDGRLYAQEVRLGGSADSVIEVGRCAVGNLVINNDAIIYKKGWMQDRSLYLGKDGLSVGEGFFVLPSGGCVNANSVRVGVSNNTVQGEVACKILRATQEIIGTVSTSSDRNKKNSIEDLDERYDQFFDALEPQRFKYNNGTSDRYHLGYITQDVQEGLVQAGLTEQDFAGVITRDISTDAEESYLRYNEFVALNTLQIQKLKKRVDVLEAKNAELEERLVKLEALLNNNAK